MYGWTRLAAFAVATLIAVNGWSQDNLDAAREEFWQGNQAYAAEDYRTALEHFELANSLAPNPRLLEYIARCHIGLGDLALAVERLEEYIATEPEGVEEAMAAVAQLRVDIVVRGIDEASQELEYAVARAMGEQPQPINRLRQRLGTAMRDVPVQILSDPRGAEVFIDGTEFGAFGITPLTTPLFTGPHLIEIRKDYYEPEQRVLNVTVPGPGETIPVVNVNLRRLEIPVELNVVPLTATVTFISDTGERRSLGAGGFSGQLPAGPCTFIVQNAGRDRRIEDVLTLPEGTDTLEKTLHLDNQEVRATVSIEVGLIRIISEFLDGSVWVDGRQVGETPGRIEADVTVGSHTVEVRRDGYIPFVQEVDVQPGAETVLYVNSLERGRRGR